jgi:hypothetical protein
MLLIVYMYGCSSTCSQVRFWLSSWRAQRLPPRCSPSSPPRCSPSSPARMRYIGGGTNLTPLLLLSLLSLSVSSVRAGQATIDDTYGDSVTGDLPTYIGVWSNASLCNFCPIQYHPDLSQLHNGTWHSAIIDISTSVTLKFTGEPPSNVTIRLALIRKQGLR